ncbi:MAG: methyltransferase family protein [Promethearchaeota archaeon]
MEIFPRIQLVFLGGWMLLVCSWLITLIPLTLLPKSVVSRLFDRSTFTRKQKIHTIISKLLGLIVLILCFFSPLIFGWELILGLTLFGIGTIGLIIAILNFKNTPLDTPVMRGLYRISRHPQEVMIFIYILGIVIAIGSGIALIILLISRIFFHYRILAEEEACIKKYGDSYLKYKKRVPRYFLRIQISEIG